MFQGQRLAELRKDHSLSQQDMANEFKVTLKTMSNYELGKTQPEGETVRQFAIKFNVSMDYLYGLTNSLISHKSELCIHLPRESTPELIKDANYVVNLAKRAHGL